LGGSLSREQRAVTVGATLRMTTTYLLEVMKRPVTEETIAETSQWIRKRIEQLFAELLHWRPGANEALRSVRAAGIPSVLVTSTERALTELALDTMGRELFAAVVCGDEVAGLNKPHPQPYLRAAELLGVDPTRCVAVEDSPPGVRSAAAAGCLVLVVPSGVAVEQGERRVFRDSLEGVDAGYLSKLPALIG
jgi:HAD superfamily hydrolase (TIGR01509 family)